MVLTLLFWLVVLLNLAVIGLWFVLGLAAATSSHTDPLEVAGIALVPVLLLGVLAFVFHRASAPVWRIAAILLAAAPALWFTITLIADKAQIAAVTDSSGQLTFFPAGPAREASLAIAKNDAAALSALLPQIQVNQPGYGGITLLTLAMRRLRATPQEQQILGLLLKAGADPNIAPGNLDDLPLSTAIQVSAEAGPEPVKLLLAAGANPNLSGAFGPPVFFGATGRGAHPEVLPAILAHGVDLTAKDKQGQTALLYAATTPHWPAVLALLERGADWKTAQAKNGQTFAQLVADRQRSHPGEPGLAEVAQFLLK